MAKKPVTKKLVTKKQLAINLQELVNQLSYVKPPPPPMKMQVDEYIELLNKIKDSDPKLQNEALSALEEYHVQLEILAENLAAKLRKIYKMKSLE